MIFCDKGLNPSQTCFYKEIWKDFLAYHLVGKKSTTQSAYEKSEKKLEPWYDSSINKETARSIRQNFIEENTQYAKATVAALTHAFSTDF